MIYIDHQFIYYTYPWTYLDCMHRLSLDMLDVATMATGAVEDSWTPASEESSIEF